MSRVKYYNGTSWEYADVAIDQKVFVSPDAPSSPTTNDFWMDTTNGLLKYYNGSAWCDCEIAKEDVANKVTSVSSSSTDTQYPSAKAMFDMLNPVDVTSLFTFDSAISNCIGKAYRNRLAIPTGYQNVSVVYAVA